MTNNQTIMTLGKKYAVYGDSRKVMKVVGVFLDEVTGTRRAQMVWASNGTTPKRRADRFLYEGTWKYHREV
jgi:hypothetical protein